ncbi:MAG: FAD:protein FMN transferase [Actinobacteria bacterium]|nr:FAD:protein FMN transferase [Actinomycetota bacterium]
MTAAGGVWGRAFPALGTFASLLVTEPSAVDAGIGLLSAELAAMDYSCSRFRPDSELSRLNQAGGRPVRVSPRFVDVLTAAVAAAMLTDGDVDPTCGQALAGLGYDRDFVEALLDTSPLPGLAAAPVPGWQAIEFDPGTGVARLPEGVMLDLSATAKALAADRAAAEIAGRLGCGVLVNLGGDISVAGDPPPGGWRVWVADDAGLGVVTPAAPPAQAVCVSDGGLATSSTLTRAWRRGTERLHHIIDPRTGRPARSCWRTASVAAGTCLDANTASVAAVIRGEQAVGWLAGLQLPARLVGHDGWVTMVAGWPRHPPAVSA